MNENQIKGTAKDIAGKVQVTVGDVVGSNKQQAMGLAKQVKGKAQKTAGDVQDAAEDVAEDSRKNR